MSELNIDTKSMRKFETGYLCGRILVALDFVQCLLGSISHEFGGIVAEEALAHIDDRLHRRRSRSLVDN